MPLPLRRRAAALSVLLILSPTGCGRDASDSGKASPRPASPTQTSPSVGLPEGERWRSGYVSESDDAEIMDVAAASATDGWAIGRDRAHVSTATEKAGGYSTFFLRYDGKSWQEYDAAAEARHSRPDRPGGVRAGQRLAVQHRPSAGHPGEEGSGPERGRLL
ncbi:hypothetical protein [Streptomyces sp. NPDC057636]|uniref:hypothetical protein n=1 Tax=Streptomyces sp. NPDC057636 TaxID=3346189 RepID=UPI0036889EA1